VINLKIEILKLCGEIIQRFKILIVHMTALQYPLIFQEKEDGYHINIKQRNPSTGEEETNKKYVM